MEASNLPRTCAAEYIELVRVSQGDMKALGDFSCTGIVAVWPP
jgi:hypothetical protein